VPRFATRPVAGSRRCTRRSRRRRRRQPPRRRRRRGRPSIRCRSTVSAFFACSGADFNKTFRP
jgi:hypothetical protein